MTIGRLIEGRDAAILTCEASMRVREAVATLADQGVHLLTLLSDLPGSRRAAYVGIDNHAAGRTAGYLMGRMLDRKSGKVGLIAGSLSYRGHEEREVGFLQVLAEQFPGLRVVGLREGHDDVAQNYRQARTLLRQHADLVALYNAKGDAGRFDEMLALFAEDATFEFEDRTLEGRAAIRAWFEDVAARTGPGRAAAFVRHFTATHQIDLLSEREARGRCYYAVLTERGLDHWGRYLDEYRVVDDRWRFARRRVTTDGRAPDTLFAPER